MDKKIKVSEEAPSIQWCDLCQAPCWVWTSRQREDGTIINAVVISLSPQQLLRFLNTTSH